jgi:hypothetical protein
MASSSAPQPITLNFQNVVRVAGETIEGHVDLNVALAQEDHIEQLRIKLRGSITTCVAGQYWPTERCSLRYRRITTQNGQTRVTHTDTVPVSESLIFPFLRNKTAFSWFNQT